MEVKSARTFEVRVPATSANLGSGFDCFGLALKLYLTVRATVVLGQSEPCRVRNIGYKTPKGETIPRNTDNLIFRAMLLVADREGLTLPPVRLATFSEIPLGRGLGSSAAAIIAGVTLGSLVCNREIPAATLLRYALELEGHADNISPCFYGGWVISCLAEGNVLAVKRRWPPDIQVLVVSPEASLKTELARSALPSTISRADAVYNLQRVALFGAALESGAHDLIWEATHDRLHQRYRQSLVPGLAETLAIPQQPGLMGLAMSGSGPSIIAFVRSHFTEIGETIAAGFRRQGIEATVRLLEVDDEGTKTRVVKR